MKKFKQNNSLQINKAAINTLIHLVISMAVALISVSGLKIYLSELFGLLHLSMSVVFFIFLQ